MTFRSALAARARKRLAGIRRRAQDPRFLRVMGRFVHEKLLVVNFEVPLHGEPIRLADVLWAGEVEPRLLELLPALLVRRPSLFSDRGALPPDLASAVAALQQDREPESFRGIAGQDVHRWLGRLGRKGKVPARLKSFRFTPEDQRLLAHLAKELGVSETDVVRRGLRALV